MKLNAQPGITRAEAEARLMREGVLGADLGRYWDAQAGVLRILCDPVRPPRLCVLLQPGGFPGSITGFFDLN